MKTKQMKLMAVILTAIVLVTSLAGCGMNKDKAIAEMEKALKASSSIDSGKMKADMKATVSLGADSIEMNLAMDGAFQDKMQTMAVKVSGQIMGMPMDTQTYQKEGFQYVLDPTSGKYLKQPAVAGTMDYQQLITMNQEEMLPMYTEAAKAAKDFAFTEEESGLRVSFTMPEEQLGKMQQGINDMMVNQMLPSIEEQMRSTVKEQVNAQLAALGGAEVDPAQLDALIEQQLQVIMEMERRLFASLKISDLHCDMLIQNGTIDDQTIKMKMEFAIKDMIEALGIVPAEDMAEVPESCVLDMEIHSLISERNAKFEVEMPEFTEENLISLQ